MRSATASAIVAQLCGVPRGTDKRPSKVEFRIEWELQQYLAKIRAKVTHEVKISECMIITGHDSSHCWYGSCEKYVSMAWGARGELFLKDVMRLVQPNVMRGERSGHLTALHVVLTAEEEKTGVPSFFNFTGTWDDLTTMSQLLCWMAATFRLPVSSRVSSSRVTFDQIQTNTSILTFEILLARVNIIKPNTLATTWVNLFPSFIVAIGFPVPSHHGAKGLMLSFRALMLQSCTNSLRYISRDDGRDQHVWFTSDTWVLYPVSYDVENNLVQWHITKNPVLGEPNYGAAPDRLEPEVAWARELTDRILFRANVVLG
ncbi:hypothetical protein S7711_11157 [Stachybotrys chartarum IBT 7711]|uniref:Uncharacterized protein n=1 Tax=Stachybotrys chartarum (strain CBS 109288 / IBT 7711) TaxID=1280523 RepID=A0A084B7F4_STACB|nr:hypothetical protein S7711_11157 [Stachybotrys chartarum IBT 7711]KFA50022.1 hypothetical protein S40293_11016 [Stachybotrys chartarum IBT 40293]